MFEFSSTRIEGLLTVKGGLNSDPRGVFWKSYQADDFARVGLHPNFQETYRTLSKKGVIRGMHFQAPPAAHAKLVWCIAGQARDVVLDLRRSSTTFGLYAVFDLAEDINLGLFIPEGCAHGFASLVDDTILMYQVTTVHRPDSDMGIRWDSFGYNWNIINPILSDRDLKHPPLADFESCFS